MKCEISPKPLFTKEGKGHPVLSGHPSVRGEYPLPSGERMKVRGRKNQILAHRKEISESVR